MARGNVRQEITLTSPNGRDFFARWEGGTRSVKKRLAQYAYAGINGQVVDDYGCDSVTYPISLIFEGEDQQKNAKDFFQEFQEAGKWLIVHPTEGLLGLQGVSATENDQPVKQANITRIDTEWIEYIDPVDLLTRRNALIEAGFAVNEMEQESRAGALSRMDNSPAGIQEADISARSVLQSVKSAYNKSQYYAQEAADAQTQFIDDLNAGILIAAGMVSSIQNLITAPGRAIADLKQRLNTLKNIIDDLFGEDKDPVEPNKNDAITKEIVATSVLASIAQGVIAASEGEESGLRSRSELLGAISIYTQLLDVITVATDRYAQASDDADPDIEDIYIPFESTNVQVKNVVAKTLNAMREQFFQLPTERRVTIHTDMTVLQIAQEFYGSTGEADEYVQRIEDANGFTGDELMVVPRGTQVRIYA